MFVTNKRNMWPIMGIQYSHNFWKRKMNILHLIDIFIHVPDVVLKSECVVSTLLDINILLWNICVVLTRLQ